MGAPTGRRGVARVCCDLSSSGDSESSGSSRNSRSGGGDERPWTGSSGVSAHTHRRRAGLPGNELAGQTSEGLSCSRRLSEEQRCSGPTTAVTLLRLREMSGLSPKSHDAPGEYWNTPERSLHAASGGCSGPPGAFSSCKIFWNSDRPVVSDRDEPPAAVPRVAACQRRRHSSRLYFTQTH